MSEVPLKFRLTIMAIYCCAFFACDENQKCSIEAVESDAATSLALNSDDEGSEEVPCENPQSPENEEDVVVRETLPESVDPDEILALPAIDQSLPVFRADFSLDLMDFSITNGSLTYQIEQVGPENGALKVNFPSETQASIRGQVPSLVSEEIKNLLPNRIYQLKTRIKCQLSNGRSQPRLLIHDHSVELSDCDEWKEYSVTIATGSRLESDFEIRVIAPANSLRTILREPPVPDSVASEDEELTAEDPEDTVQTPTLDSWILFDYFELWDISNETYSANPIIPNNSFADSLTFWHPSTTTYKIELLASDNRQSTLRIQGARETFHHKALNISSSSIQFLLPYQKYELTFEYRCQMGLNDHFRVALKNRIQLSRLEIDLTDCGQTFKQHVASFSTDTIEDLVVSLSARLTGDNATFARTPLLFQEFVELRALHIAPSP
jgi:hypothetical protein